MESKLCVLLPCYQPPGAVLSCVKMLHRAGVEDILVVDDGSGATFAPLFEQLGACPGCEVIGYEKNRGKGGALKYGFAHIRATRPECGVVVTADCDGQHTVPDVMRVAQAAQQQPGTLVLGVRDFSRTADGKPVPLRSRLGNWCSTVVFWLLHQFWLTDTQTGLRGFTAGLLEYLENVPGSRYEYETEVLTHCMRDKVPLKTLPITTVYENNNETSHFHPLRDSSRIMGVMLREFGRFLAVSLGSAVVDLLLAWLLLDLLRPVMGGSDLLRIGAATVLARLVSMVVNYTLNRILVFQAKQRPRRSFGRYLVLCAAVMVLSSGTVYLTSQYLLWNEKLAKLVADSLLFLLSYRLQRMWVFAK